MNTLKALLGGLARTAAVKPNFSPVAHAAQPTAVTRPTTFAAPTAHSFLDHHMTGFFPSPLAAKPGLQQSDVDRLCAVYSDPDVQRAADKLHLKLDRLNEIALYRSLIAEAIDRAEGVGIAPIDVLRQMEMEADEALEDARADHRAHDRVVKARNDRLRALVIAVGQIGGNAVSERERITWNIAALESQHANTGVDAQRFHQLKAAGLTDVQIASLGQPAPEITGAKVAALRARLVEIEGVLAQCRAFSQDPLRRGHHLAGLGLDALVAQAHPEQADAEVTA